MLHKRAGNTEWQWGEVPVAPQKGTGRIGRARLDHLGNHQVCPRGSGAAKKRPQLFQSVWRDELCRIATLIKRHTGRRHGVVFCGGGKGNNDNWRPLVSCDGERRFYQMEWERGVYQSYKLVRFASEMPRPCTMACGA